MSTAAIISIRPQYANKILDGTKSIELRKSAMGLGEGDVILVYSSAPEQRLAFWFRIRAIEALPLKEMWASYSAQLGINCDDYYAYFNGLDVAVGLHIGEIQPFSPIPLKEIEALVPGFVPPQGILWLRDEMGRFRNLLSKLSIPLPDDVFLQRSLRF
jgi:predicted transcriptional regulator